MLGHLDTVLVVDVTQHDTILERRFVKQKRRYRKQGVKPTSRLVYRFAYKVGRKLLLEYFFVLKWIVKLSKRHTSAVKPAIHNFGSAFHLAAALALEDNSVDIRLVKFDIFFKSAEFSQFRSAAYYLDFSAVGTYPDGKRSSPISLS